MKQRNLLTVLLVLIIAAVVSGYQVTTDCKPNSTFACVKLAGTSSGYALILVRPNAGQPQLYLPTENGEQTLATREWVMAQLGQPTPTPTPLPSPTASATPTPTPSFQPYDLGVNFRATSGFVSDGIAEVYCLGDKFPTVRGGATFGWLGSVDARNRNAAVDRRLAGMNFTTNTQQSFRLNLPTGVYDLRLAMGETEYPQRAAVEVYDDTNLRFSLGSVAVNAGQFIDAGGVARTIVTWPTANVARSVTVSSGILIVRIGGTNGNFVIAHLQVHRIS